MRADLRLLIYCDLVIPLALRKAGVRLLPTACGALNHPSLHCTGMTQHVLSPVLSKELQDVVMEQIDKEIKVVGTHSLYAFWEKIPLSYPNSRREALPKKNTHFNTGKVSCLL